MDLNELISRIDAVDFISQYVDLTEKSGELWGISPFTSPPEKTPSFSVRRETGKFFDFSSGIGGSVYTFLRFLGKTKREAIECLKEYAGIDGTIHAPSNRLDITKCCIKFAKKDITSKPYNPNILDDNYMDRFEDNQQKLAVWENEGISKETLEKYCVKYDKYSNRLVYPIYDTDGRLVNVGGRTLCSDYKERGLRKYTYMQGWGGSMALIYGLYNNIENIKKKREIILFEGCKSVMLADTWGIQNCGALLTSHLNPEQMRILIKLGADVVFMLDREIDIRKDHNASILKNYTNVFYYIDYDDLLGEKDAPVDKGEDVFKILYEGRVRYK